MSQEKPPNPAASKPTAPESVAEQPSVETPLGTILVIEDVFLVRKTIEGMLRSGRFTVLEANGPEQATKILAAQQPNLIILDMMLPNMDGLTFCKELQKNAKTKDIPVVMCTARGDRAAVMAAKQVGVKDYVVKPFKKEVLLAKVCKVLNLTPP